MTDSLTHYLRQPWHCRQLPEVPDSSEAGEHFTHSLPKFPPRKQVAGISSPLCSEGAKSRLFEISGGGGGRILLEKFLISLFMKVGDRGVFAGRSVFHYGSAPSIGEIQTPHCPDRTDPPHPGPRAGICPSTPRRGRGWELTPRSSITQISARTLYYYSPGLPCPGKTSR